MRFPGFLAVYEEARSEDVASEDEEENAKIPSGIAEGQAQELVRVIPEQHFTQPPPRLSEASLVQAAGGKRDWAAIHICSHHLDDPAARVRPA